MSYSTLVSTETLAANLDRSWVVVDCRYALADEAWGRAQYLIAHVPGAVYASLSRDLSGPAAGGGGRHPIPSPAAMHATFGRLGIGSGIQVVLYDQGTEMFACRMWWMLRYLGHDAVAVLDGGWSKWTREGRPTRAGEETRPAATFVGAPQEGLRVGVGDVERRLGDPSMLLVDARSPERFEGASESVDRVAGHIPGAVNRHYKRNLAPDGVMLPAGTLREQFDEMLEGRRPDQLVMYCGSGVSACHNLLAMEHAGLRGSKLYPGSWSEWSTDETRQVESGKSGRSGKSGTSK